MDLTKERFFDILIDAKNFILGLVLGIYSPSLLCIGRPRKGYLWHWKIKNGIRKLLGKPITYVPFVWNEERKNTWLLVLNKEHENE